MKIRRSFVSNSSSSSFICVVPTDHVNTVLDNCNNQELVEFIKSIKKDYQLNDKNGHVLGMTVLSHDGYGGSKLGDYFDTFYDFLKEETKDIIIKYFH